jgi:hypothetical protein
MAKYTPSAILGQLSKSAGSTTFGHNRNGSYLRTKVIPTNPRRTLQTVQRGIVSGFASLYRTLTAAQRNGWAALGAGITRNDSLGNPYTLTGLQAYISVNRNIRIYGGTAVTDAPTLTIPSAITLGSVIATA